jgi:hypothetical protein
MTAGRIFRELPTILMNIPTGHNAANEDLLIFASDMPGGFLAGQITFYIITLRQN